jgi:hypothetical protein
MVRSEANKDGYMTLRPVLKLEEDCSGGPDVKGSVQSNVASVLPSNDVSKIPCPGTSIPQPREALSDAELWEQARTTPFNDILSTITRSYRASCSDVPQFTKEIYDAWYMEQWAADGLETKDTLQEEQLLYPKWYTPRLDKLNKEIHELLECLNGNESDKASHSRPMMVCLCGYLMLLREQFTYELREALLGGKMSKNWRSASLNPWLHRERCSCQHSREGRLELKASFGEAILQTDASALCKCGYAHHLFILLTLLKFFFD